MSLGVIYVLAIHLPTVLCITYGQLVMWLLHPPPPPTAVGDVLVALLDSEDRELVYSACGVLLNVMIAPELRPLLANTNGVRK